MKQHQEIECACSDVSLMLWTKMKPNTPKTAGKIDLKSSINIYVLDTKTFNFTPSPGSRKYMYNISLPLSLAFSCSLVPPI
jgi:hypothetical protein